MLIGAHRVSCMDISDDTRRREDLMLYLRGLGNYSFGHDETRVRGKNLQYEKHVHVRYCTTDG